MTLEQIQHSGKCRTVFDKINPFEEVADDRAIGKLTEVLTSIGIPGAAGFKAATSLADKAMKLKRAGKYTSLKNPNIIKGAVQADKLNKELEPKIWRWYFRWRCR